MIRNFLARSIPWLCGVAVLMPLSFTAYGGDVGFTEEFALAENREEVLKKLIPGTDDYYYYHALHYQHTEQFEKIEPLLAQWVQRKGETPLVWRIRTRQALLNYDRDPQKSLEYLRQRLGIQFNHERERLDAEPQFPTALDNAAITRAAFTKRALAQGGEHLNEFEDRGLYRLLETELSPIRRRHLLSRMTRPDHVGLVKAIAADLDFQGSGGFGSIGIHRMLLLAQLEELLKLKPELLQQQAFVAAYIAKLQPSNDDNITADDAVLVAYLERLQTFADRLAPVHNSLKALVQYHRLTLDRRLGKLDRERFNAYLKLPRRVNYGSKAALESEELRRFPCDFNNNYGTLLAPIGNDEPLVRAYLAEFLRSADDTKAFEPWVNDVYLKHLFAETKITAGLGDGERWASLLPAEAFRKLKDRVDIDFAPTNKTRFTAEEPIALDLELKNVGTLIVKTFEINAANYYKSQGKEIDTDINLDGLTANLEQTHTIAQPPLLRKSKRFEFPQLNKAGVYVIDFIGNGRSSRVLVRKGSIAAVVRMGAAGPIFTVYDESRKPIADASLHLGAREFKTNPQGEITIPFSTEPGRRTAVITARTPAGEISTLESFEHPGEEYRFDVGFHIDRESLIAGKKAKLLIRPALTMHGIPVTLKLAEQVSLTLISTDRDGITAVQEIGEVKLFEDRETTHEFKVPARAAAIEVRLTAKVKRVTAGGEQETLTASRSFALNAIDASEKTEDLHFLRTSTGYFLELRGRTGEPKPSRPIRLAVKHRDFRDIAHFTLKTDPAGRVALGMLSEIELITATGPQEATKVFSPGVDRALLPGVLHGLVGQTLLLPFTPRDPAAALSRDEISLLELHGEERAIDRFEHLSLKNGMIAIERLPAGDYDLYLRGAEHSVRVRMTQGIETPRHILGSSRLLQKPLLPPLHIASIGKVPSEKKDAPGQLKVQLVNAGKLTRVHVFASRFAPEYDLFSNLTAFDPNRLGAEMRVPPRSVYLTGRNIGDEYRYIIDRKYATKFAGNMLERPGLLLHPWAVRDTETSVQTAQGGEDFMARGEAMMKRALQGAGGRGPSANESAANPNFANLDFLALGGIVIPNLEPDENGVLMIDLAALGGKQHVRVVAVDPLNTVVRETALEEGPLALTDLRLLDGLDPQKHFLQRKRISIVPQGEKFTLHDITSGKFEAFDSLARVHGLYTALSGNDTLNEFSFVLRWPKLKAEEKRELYSKYASHELNFFLFKKDVAFFKAVVVPALENKRDKTFLDEFLLERDLRPYLQPWKFGRLNAVERVLLAQRLADERPAAARHAGDLLSMRPINLELFMHRFDTAVNRGALERNDSLNLGERLSELRAELRDRKAGDGPGVVAMGGAAFGVNGLPAPTAAAAPASPPAPAKPAADAAPPRAARRMAMDKAEKQVEEAAKAMQSKKGSTDENRGVNRALERESVESLAVELYDSDGAELAVRKMQEVLFRVTEKTKEWAENNYYHLTIDRQTAELIGVNQFWRDLADHDPQKPFLSRHLAEATSNFSEMMFALSMLDLPFESPEHKSEFEGAKMTLIPGGPLVVFHEEIESGENPPAGAETLVSQNYFRYGDQKRMENGEEVDKFVTDEFLVHTVYGCRTVVTNPTSTRRKLTLLLQIPHGAIGVLNARATRTIHVTLEPYHTQTFEYHFYFPAPGDYAHFPIHAAKNETLVAAAPARTLKAVEKPSKIDTESWDYVSQHGTLEQTLAMLDRENVHALPLEKIAWRMRDPKAFAAVVEKLAKRKAYRHVLWSYALFHADVPAAEQFLRHADRAAEDCGGRIRSAVLTLDGVERHSYEHLEYRPLINARSHKLGEKRQIVNDRFHAQYHRYLDDISFAPKLSDEDRLAAAYYLMLQDRFDEAVPLFAKIDRAKIAEKMQYDYFRAYLSFSTGELETARAIVTKYADLGVDRWRNAFAAVAAQLDEIEGKNVAVVDPKDRTQSQTAAAESEATFELAVEAGKIKIDSRNLKSIQLNYYEIDIELLFSRNPFVQRLGGEFAFIRPNLSQEVKPAEKGGESIFELPKEFAGKNVLVEAIGGGKSRTQAYYSNTLSVQIMENNGQVKVTGSADDKPISKAYVKVYAQTPSGVKFYKDGYTDLRGRFDYASLSTDDLGDVSKFAVLVMSDANGSLVRETDPPAR